MRCIGRRFHTFCFYCKLSRNFHTPSKLVNPDCATRTSVRNRYAFDADHAARLTCGISSVYLIRSRQACARAHSPPRDTFLEFSPIRPLYVAISLASWQRRKHSAPPRPVPPEKLRQEKTECRLGIFRTSLGGRPSILSELAPRKVCGLFHLRSTCTSESLL